MAWIHLLIASVFEIAWAIGLKYTYGFTRLVPSLVTVALMVASFSFLALAMRTLPLGTAYAVWVGIGVVGTTIAGIMLFGEPADVVRIVCIVVVLAGVVGLKLLTP